MIGGVTSRLGGRTERLVGTTEVPRAAEPFAPTKDGLTAGIKGTTSTFTIPFSDVKEGPSPPTPVCF